MGTTALFRVIIWAQIIHDPPNSALAILYLSFHGCPTEHASQYKRQKKMAVRMPLKFKLEVPLEAPMAVKNLS
jgi:hypothetical protein